VDPNLAAAFVNQCYENAIGYPFCITRLTDYVDETSFTPDWVFSTLTNVLLPRIISQAGSRVDLLRIHTIFSGTNFIQMSVPATSSSQK